MDTGNSPYTITGTHANSHLTEAQPAMRAAVARPRRRPAHCCALATLAVRCGAALAYAAARMLRCLHVRCSAAYYTRSTVCAQQLPACMAGTGRGAGLSPNRRHTHGMHIGGYIEVDVVHSTCRSSRTALLWNLTAGAAKSGIFRMPPC
eukprot:COSAG01_NODE_5919_length_3955_cov_7.127593_1_plen_149_part_00